MSLPANIRVNAQLPFPSLITGTGPITIGKANGIWQIGFTIDAFGSQNPGVGSFPTDFLLAYDSLNKVFFKISLSDLVAAVNSGAVRRLQRLVTATPIVIASIDQIINCDINATAACALPASVLRAGAPLTFKDLGQAAAHNITITPNGAETIDGLASLVLKNNFQSVTLVPFNDGTNAGWAIE